MFPAQTLAYLEFRQPERLSREVASLVRGSALDDMPAVLAKYREKRGDNNMFFFEDMFVGYLSMFACSEIKMLVVSSALFTPLSSEQEMNWRRCCAKQLRARKSLT